MIDRSRRFRKTVPALTTIYDDVIIPAGKTWRLQSASGSADFTGNTQVEVIWERSAPVPTYLFSTYGHASQTLHDELVGDGVKRISIKLRNALTVAATLMGEYAAVEE